MWLSTRKKKALLSTVTLLYESMGLVRRVSSVVKRLSLLQAAESRQIDFGSVPNVHILFSLAYTVYRREPRVHIVPEINNSMFSAICLCERVSTELNLKEIYTMDLLNASHKSKCVCVHCSCLQCRKEMSEWIFLNRASSCKHFHRKTGTESSLCPSSSSSLLFSIGSGGGVGGG